MFTEVAVVYPRGSQTGGPEALHQLVDSLRRHGHDAYLVPDRGTENRPRAEVYAVYDAPERAIASDAVGTAVVVAETAAVTGADFREATVFRWWLSVNNAPSEGGPIAEKEFDLGMRGEWEPLPVLQRVGTALHAAYSGRRTTRSDEREIDLAQSLYAWTHIFSQTRRPPSLLTDYTPSPQELVAAGLPLAQRRRQVCFNPKKSGHLAREVSQQLPDVDFVPIENMTREQVVATLAESAVYLDLGAHPGKDRIPREAALAGAVVVVAMRGSAAFHADVPVPIEHKVPFDEQVVDNARTVIVEVLADLELASRLQSSWRADILEERAVFDVQVRAVFTHGLRGFDSTASVAETVARLTP